MPLSEHEQRLLDQMEQQLYADDPKFVSRLNENPQRAGSRKRAVIGAVVVLLGLGLVVLGVVSQLIWIGGVGFAVMVAGGGYALTPVRGGTLGAVDDDGQVTPHRKRRFSRVAGHAGGAGAGAGKTTGASRRTSGTFMERMEQRWERRRGGQDGW